MDRAVAETRIRRDYLIAMEKDDFSFQAPAYVKGLVSNYARFLRLDPAPLLEKLPEDGVSSPNGATALAQKNAAWTGAFRVPSAARPIIVTTGALLILTALALWGRAEERRGPQRDRGGIEASEQEVRSESPAR